MWRNINKEGVLQKLRAGIQVSKGNPEELQGLPLYTILQKTKDGRFIICKTSKEKFSSSSVMTIEISDGWFYKDSGKIAEKYF